LENHVSSFASRTKALLDEAVFGHNETKRVTLIDRLFARVFSGLVYTQIWEDPLVDLEALALEDHHRMVTISSAGCNALSYLSANPARIDVVDLNGAHLALLELKLAAARSFVRYDDFERMFADAADPANVSAYDTLIRDRLSPAARAYWDEPAGILGRERRIDMFRTGFFRHGLLGRFIRVVRGYAALRGVDIGAWTSLRSVSEQQAWFDSVGAKVFDGGLIRLICRSPLVLYYLGIPPRQFLELCEDRPGDMHAILRERARALLTTGTVDENYFAWQAVTGGYRRGGPYPPYLARESYAQLCQRVDRIGLHHVGMREFLAAQPAASVDRLSLLDAMDWMDDAELNRLWTEITRTARPGARVIFRTAATQWRAGQRLPADLAARWCTDEAENRRLTAQDRSGIYGRFHVLTLQNS
jgi:S-adenosylmethionine-diacylglycerol 3-amino-3-carboxypropyl transferase